MKKIILSIFLLTSLSSFADLYGNDENWDYSEAELYDKYSTTIISKECKKSKKSFDNCMITDSYDKYLIASNKIVEKIKSNKTKTKLTKEEKLFMDNVYIAYFDINWLKKKREYNIKKAAGYGEAIIHQNIDYLNTYQAYYNFLYSFKQFIKQAKTYSDYARVDRELRNDFHYLWQEPFEWRPGTGVPVK